MDTVTADASRPIDSNACWLAYLSAELTFAPQRCESTSRSASSMRRGGRRVPPR